MNDLEALTTARDFLLKQNSKAVDCLNKCAYRGDYDKKCGVGCLIPDEMYSYGFEGESVNCIVDNSTALQELFKDVKMVVLHDIQRIHDSCNVEDWEHEFNILIEQEKLDG